MSAFYDVPDVLHQNQSRRNMPHTHRSYSINAGTDHKIVGTPITGANRNRNMLERSLSEPADRNANAQIMQQQQQQQQQQQRQTQNGNINSSRYKTELCRPFEENGFCKYGDKCQFAHGHHELRSLARHPKYKTELCRTFHTVGFCPYGPRCHFIHNEDERKLSQIDHLKQPQDVQQQHQSVQHQSHQHQPSHPQQVPHGRSPPPQRPVRFTLPLTVCDPLGSTADSPPSSVTDSPTLSPTFINDSDTLSSLSSSSFSPPISAPPAQFRTFTFQDLPGQGPTLMSPLNIHTDQIATLAAGIQAALSLNQRNNFANNLQQHSHTTAFGSPVDHDMYAPPSPPDSLCGDSTSSLSGSSMCGSPLEVSRGLRLPIFAALSMD